jgi:hypothetical protein
MSKSWFAFIPQSDENSEGKNKFKKKKIFRGKMFEGRKV